MYNDDGDYYSDENKDDDKAGDYGNEDCDHDGKIRWK